jgi:iron complex outermembrane receptor protein
VDANPEGPQPKAEELQDAEAGYSIRGKWYNAGLTFYNMNYNDQLILTGEINDVGSALMVNVDKSYRRGIELTGGINLNDKYKWTINATFSKNKIQDFTEYVDNWDTWAQDSFHLGNTNISFSPEIILNNSIEVSPVQNFTIALNTQYVGKQYIDNTSNNSRMLDAYLVNNVRLGYKLNPGFMKEIEFQLLVNNILNSEYETNAWVYSYLMGNQRYEMDGYFPQAGINFLAGITLTF